MSLKDTLSYEPVELSFGTSGLRGLVTDMTDLECYINAIGFMRFLAKEDALIQGSRVFLGGDLRTSTPRIMQVMTAAITDAGYVPVYCGKIPTPALAYYALMHKSPCIMVTGSHIPADRNGIKFYKSAGEILKTDETVMQQHVTLARAEVYSSNVDLFDSNGSLQLLPALPVLDSAAETEYLKRYTDLFSDTSLSGKKIVMYQHSAVGRDVIAALLEALGAEVVRVGRTDTFVSIDTENVREKEKALDRKS